jgi:signal transduction histidine kinase
MNLIAGTDANLLFALNMVITGLGTLAILWNARSPAVYLYVVSIFLGAIYYSVFTGRLGLGSVNDLFSRLLLCFGAVGGAWLKNLSLGLLETPGYRLAAYGKGTVLIAIGMVTACFLFPDPLSFSAVLTISVIAIMARVSWLGYRIGDRVGSPAARVFAVLIAFQLVALSVSVLSMIITGEHFLSDTQPTQSILSTSFTIGLGLLNASLFIGLVLDLNIREREDAQKAVTTLEVARSRAHEREMLLADMHDGLGSQISTARLRVERGEMTQADIIHLLRECSADLHLMVDTLREQNDSLEAALVDYKTRVERRIAEQGIGLAWSIQLDGAPAMSARRMLQVLRIIQESISNAVRHAGAREIIVAARYLGEAVYHIKVEDDGAGIADDVSPGRGLSNMRRRARDLGGSLDVRRRANGRGTEVILSFEDRPV